MEHGHLLRDRTVTPPLPVSRCHLATKAFATLFYFGPLAPSLPTASGKRREVPGTPLHTVPGVETCSRHFAS